MPARVARSRRGVGERSGLEWTRKRRGVLTPGVILGTAGLGGEEDARGGREGREGGRLQTQDHVQAGGGREPSIPSIPATSKVIYAVSAPPRVSPSPKRSLLAPTCLAIHRVSLFLSFSSPAHRPDRPWPTQIPPTRHMLPTQPRLTPQSSPPTAVDKCLQPSIGKSPHRSGVSPPVASHSPDKIPSQPQPLSNSLMLVHPSQVVSRIARITKNQPNPLITSRTGLSSVY